MKLGIVTAYPPSKVTLNEYGYHLLQHFKMQKGITEIILLCDKTQDEKVNVHSSDGCKITIKECWEFNSYNNLFSISKAIKESKADCVFINLQFLKFGDKKIPAALGLMLPLVNKIKGIPTISLLHNILEQVDLESAGFTKNPILKRLYRGVGNMLTRFILSSDIVAVTISKYVTVLSEKYKTKKVKLVPHGSFETPPEPSYDLPNGPKQVMSFGKFGTYKKVEAMIEAVEKVRQRTSEDIEIVIAGTDSPNTPGYLDGVAKKYSDIEKIRFTGYVAEEDVPVIFSEAAIAVFPYTSTTGSSGVLHQAGSYGKAVAMPDLGDLSILVKEEGYQGEFFIPEDVDSMSEAIEKVLVNDQYRIDLGVANYEAACSIPMSRIAEIYVEEFNKLIVLKDKGNRVGKVKSQTA
ncbi:glycosyltransferase [Saccharicrinis aurantiacus]|uniref:glycosyltransferase n=1 Tax=Saccharicrinis aurantiacus TaxID=1849719 RepID=UPI0024924E4C|nr:glycosyltransferase [Saccharicrinis aurantiacus]